MSDKRFQIKTYIELVITKLQALQRYSVVIFIVFVAVLYSFLVLRINTLSSAQPTEEAISSQVKAAKVPHVDEEVVKQLKSLEDNSVSVKTLFNKARNNPFQ